MFDRALPGYRVCVRVADTLRSAYQGVGSLGDVAEPDSIECVEWEWEGRKRINCSGKVEHAITTGGRWSHEDGSGWYRVILTQEPTMVRGWRRPQRRPHVYVQWLERAPGNALHQVRETIELPIESKVTSLWVPALWERYGRWYASFRGTRQAFLNDFARAEITFRLGSPGQASRTEAP